jgi:hypothetical protein
LCPCGSGKKYKKCHGNADRDNRMKVAQNEPNKSEVRLEPMGVPGQAQHIIFVAQFADPADPRNASGPSGQPGKYKVVFVLNRPGYPLLSEHRRAFSNELKGDSHLAILRPAFVSPQNEGATKIRVYAQTALRQLIFECQGRSKNFPPWRRKRGPLVCFRGPFPVSLGAAGAEPYDPLAGRA